MFGPAGDKEKKNKKSPGREISSKQITVFSMVELFTNRDAPAGYSRSLFHSRENEANCSGCHPLEVKADAPQPKKPDEMICYACHRMMTAGKHVHGPVAVWNCIGCHDPEIYPVKYQFTAEDPWKVIKTVQSVEPVVVTIPNDALFNPGSAVIPGASAAKNKKQEKARNEALEKLKKQFKDVLAYAALNPGDRVRIESHTGQHPPPEAEREGEGFQGQSGAYQSESFSSCITADPARVEREEKDDRRGNGR
jgi:flagellar motor protein MotB